jgi:hypothetical protein
MDFSVVSLVFNALLGFIMYLMRNTNDTLREDIRNLKERQEHFQENYAKRDEVKELKEDFNRRFDRFESNIKEWLVK